METKGKKKTYEVQSLPIKEHRRLGNPEIHLRASDGERNVRPVPVMLNCGRPKNRVGQVQLRQSAVLTVEALDREINSRARKGAEGFTANPCENRHKSIQVTL